MTMADKPGGGRIIGALTPDCVEITSVSVDLKIKLLDSGCLGYTNLSCVCLCGAPCCVGYIEVVADSVCSVGPHLVGVSTETTNEDGITVCSF